MLILFFYIIFNLFTGADTSQDSSTIDVIVRTSVAAIFGYFISSNFTGTNSSTAPQNTDNNTGISLKSEEINSDSTIKNQIGFKPSAIKSSSEEPGRISFSENSLVPIKSCNKIQVIVVSTIGLISLIILFITRYSQNITPEFTATISQLRDFVSACIGFLISYGKNSAD